MIQFRNHTTTDQHTVRARVLGARPVSHNGITVTSPSRIVAVFEYREGDGVTSTSVMIDDQFTNEWTVWHDQDLFDTAPDWVLKFVATHRPGISNSSRELNMEQTRVFLAQLHASGFPDAPPTMNGVD